MILFARAALLDTRAYPARIASLARAPFVLRKGRTGLRVCDFDEDAGTGARCGDRAELTIAGVEYAALAGIYNIARDLEAEVAFQHNPPRFFVAVDGFCGCARQHVEHLDAVALVEAIPILANSRPIRDVRSCMATVSVCGSAVPNRDPIARYAKAQCL